MGCDNTEEMRAVERRRRRRKLSVKVSVMGVKSVEIKEGCEECEAEEEMSVKLTCCLQQLQSSKYIEI